MRTPTPRGLLVRLPLLASALLAGCGPAPDAGAGPGAIAASGKIAMPLAIEGGHAIENSLETLRDFHAKGLSSMTLTHNASHDWADYHQAMSELVAVGRPWHRRVPPPAGPDLRSALDHLNQGRDWPLENLPTLEDLLDPIDHAVAVAGVDHVGLGADMYPHTHSPVGIRGVHDYPNITAGLKARGYSDEDVRKIMGGNLLRVWKAVAG